MKLKIKASRWPWQQGHSHRFMGRFGGGWEYNLGFQTGGWKNGQFVILFNLLWGQVHFSIYTNKGWALKLHNDAAFREWQRQYREREANVRVGKEGF